MIYQLRMLSDENDNFVRGYELEDTSSLLDLHQLICRDLDFDPAAVTSFYASDSQWEKHQEYTLEDMGAGDELGADAPRTMAETPLFEVLGKKFARLIYLFDMMGDRALFLEMVEAKNADGQPYPRVVLSEGDAPGQFEPEGGGSIFDDIMSDFNDFEGDDSYEDD